jgi:hypothetical protein
VRAYERQQLLLTLQPFWPRLGESRRDHAQGARSRPQRLLRGRDHVLAGKADDAEVDRVSDLFERTMRADARHRLAGAVDRVRGAREAAGEEVPEDQPADRPGPGGGADDGDGAGLEEGSERRGDRDVVALVDARLIALGRRDRESHLDDAAVERPGRDEPDVLEHRQHRPVLR